MYEPTLEERVLVELRALRKLTQGATVESLARATTICDLLGAGDPYVTYARLTHEILESELGMSIKAAAASLGFSSSGDTHLTRLDEYGAEAGLEQRQVRRYSDKGLRALARLISTNWPTDTAPQLTTVVAYEGLRWRVQLTTRRLLTVEMRQPGIEVLTGPDSFEPEIEWRAVDRGRWQHANAIPPVFVEDVERETSVVIVWRGELWPKYNTAWLGASPTAQSESLGNKLMLRLRALEGASRLVR